MYWNIKRSVLYVYIEKDMRQRPVGWPLPRPGAVHHMVEDFLTEWNQPISHSQPLRRFLEHCLQTDLRAFYAGQYVLYTNVRHLSANNIHILDVLQYKSLYLLVQRMLYCK